MIYLDHSATGYPKPLTVQKAAAIAMARNSFNIGRGGYSQSLSASEKVYEVREKLGRMFTFLPEEIIFTKNCTEALNLAIRGIAREGDHFIISSLEHNSVYRVVYQLQEEGRITFDIAPFSFSEEETLQNFEQRITAHTKAIICTCASNVFGVTLPIKKIGALCRKHRILMIADAAQGAGILPLDARKCHIDLLCAAGHKGMMGPMGTGFLAVRNGIQLRPVMTGGTGSRSLSAEQPSFYPDRLESGTLNVPGIIALGAGTDYLKKQGIEALYQKELMLLQELFEMLRKVKNVTLYTPYPEVNQAVPLLSFNVLGKSSEAVALALSEKGICVRGGYQCAPLAHQHFHTEKSGTVRVSIGCRNKRRDLLKLVNVVKNL